MKLGNLLSRIASLRSRAAGPEDTGRPYVYQPAPTGLTYAEAVAALVNKGYDARPGGVEPLSDDLLDRLSHELAELEVYVEDYVVNVREYDDYIQKAGYLERYKDYYWDVRSEKALEHFLAFKELALSPHHRFVDIASEHSPVPEIYRRLSNATCYGQDIQYAAGIEDDRIGGDACAMPVSNGFATSAALTCSLEHFERDGDVRLFAEISRILGPAGKLVIAPLYMSLTEATQTDPLLSVAANVQFDEGCIVYCKEGWGNRHGRFYSPRSLVDRLIRRHNDTLDFKVFRIRNHGELPEGIYLRLFMTCTRR